MEEEIKAKKEEYLKTFDNIFNTSTKEHINLKRVPLISMIYKNFTRELMKMSNTYLKLRKRSFRIYNKLEQTFSKEQKKLLNKYFDIEAEMEAELLEQVFIFGYIFALELENESERSV